MGVWNKVFAAGYDSITARSERDTFSAHRRALLAGAAGDVIEIGGGTGANLRMYDGAIGSLTVTEPEEAMIGRLQRKIDEQRPGTKVVRAPAEDLPFEDDGFDTAVSTLVLCTVDDQPRALRELRRVLRPGGRLLFMEHVRSDDERISALAGPDAAAEPPAPVRLPLQPPDARRDPKRGVRGDEPGTRHDRPRAGVRQAADRGRRPGLTQARAIGRYRQPRSPRW